MAGDFFCLGKTVLDRFQKLATQFCWLKWPMLVLSAVFLGLLINIILNPNPEEGDGLLIPYLVGLLWSASGAAFVMVFPSVPTYSMEAKWFARIKIRVIRLWYWFIALIFAASSIATLLLSYRLLSFFLSRGS